ncbi:helix-turn-helix transcriptional regulator [Klebsiella aerogenes]|nr:helix-turn-helix transcriptional regulator [Klebsiella aerogenes]ELY3087275.1 helix-turn-helix transcriptional regulator [Klebsiella aerogenes]
MIYIITEDYYLFNGIKALVTPCDLSLKWLTLDLCKEIIPHQFTNNDVIVIDTRINPLLIFPLITKCDLSIPFIFLKDKLDIPVKIINNPCNVLDFNSSFSEILYAILTNSKNSRQKGVDKQLFLSSKEVDIMNLLIEGVSVNKIAESLSMNNKTVYTYKRNICQKLGVRRISQLLPYKSFVRQNVSGMENQANRYPV